MIADGVAAPPRSRRRRGTTAGFRTPFLRDARELTRRDQVDQDVPLGGLEHHLVSGSPILTLADPIATSGHAGTEAARMAHDQSLVIEAGYRSVAFFVDGAGVRGMVEFVPDPTTTA
jgi:hypothetical protein